MDQEYMRVKREELIIKRDAEAEILAYWGFFRGEDGNSFILQEVMEWIEFQLGKHFVRTKEGKISTDKEAMKEIQATPHPFTQAYSKFVGYDKIIGTYLRANTDHDLIMAEWEAECQEARDATAAINEELRLANEQIEIKNADKIARGKRPQKLKKYKNPVLPLKPKLKANLIGVDGRMHAYFKPMVRTGRTSCSGPNLQNLPRDGGVRGQYEAPKGSVFFQCDYSQLELCALAQHCYINYEIPGHVECVMQRRQRSTHVVWSKDP